VKGTPFYKNQPGSRRHFSVSLDIEALSSTFSGKLEPSQTTGGTGFLQVAFSSTGRKSEDGYETGQRDRYPLFSHRHAQRYRFL
jgi:hypothetical protein